MKRRRLAATQFKLSSTWITNLRDYANESPQFFELMQIWKSHKILLFVIFAMKIHQESLKISQTKLCVSLC